MVAINLTVPLNESDAVRILERESPPVAGFDAAPLVLSQWARRSDGRVHGLWRVQAVVQPAGGGTPVLVVGEGLSVAQAVERWRVGLARVNERAPMPPGLQSDDVCRLDMAGVRRALEEFGAARRPLVSLHIGLSDGPVLAMRIAVAANVAGHGEVRAEADTLEAAVRALRATIESVEASLEGGPAK